MLDLLMQYWLEIDSKRNNEQMPGWVIELITSSVDLGAIIELNQTLFSNSWTRQMYLKDLENRQVSRMYVLRSSDESVAAFCSCWLIYDELQINNVAVLPSQRNLGIGTILLRHVLGEAAKEGARRAILEVRRSNRIALRLYERVGFRLHGTRGDYYSNPQEDALVLCRDMPLC